VIVGITLKEARNAIGRTCVYVPPSARARHPSQKPKVGVIESVSSIYVMVRYPNAKSLTALPCNCIELVPESSGFIF